MTDIKVTQVDIDTVRLIRLSEQVWYQQDRIARHRIEAQRPLLEALEKAEKTFRWYGDLHAAKPDTEKAARNYELADEMRAAIKKAKG